MNAKTSLVALALTAGIASGCMYRYSAAGMDFMAHRFVELEDVMAPCSLINGWHSDIASLRDRCVRDAQEQYDLYQIPEVRQMFPGFDCTPQYGCLTSGNTLVCPEEGMCSILDENGTVIAGGEQ